MAAKWIELSLEFGVLLLKKRPDYDQKKKEEFYDKKSLYDREKVKEDHERDDDLLLNLKDDLFNLVSIFKKEIGGL